MQQESQPFSRHLRERMISLDKKDWELWILALLMMGVLAAGFFVILLPSVFFGQGEIEINARISPQLLLGFLVLVLMFIAYLIRKHFQVRAMRGQSLTDAWHAEVAHMQSLVDPLTKALNRSSLEEILNREIKRVQRRQSTLSFLYLDVDDFKNVNTRFGHLSGDLVLAEVGGILKRCVRGSDYVIRMGGDEFLAALVDTDQAGAEVVKRRIHVHVEEWNRNSPLPDYRLGLSIGVQAFDPERTLDQALAEADSKMYSVKKERQQAGQA